MIASAVAISVHAQHRGPDGVSPVRACAGRQHHGVTPSERDRGHEDRAEPLARGLDHGLVQRHAGLGLFLGEFDDQNGVLARQTDHRQQADLEEDAVVELAQRAPIEAPPKTPIGITRMTAKGIDQLSYSAARHRNTAASDNA